MNIKSTYPNNFYKTQQIFLISPANGTTKVRLSLPASKVRHNSIDLLLIDPFMTAMKHTQI